MRIIIVVIVAALSFIGPVCAGDEVFHDNTKLVECLVGKSAGMMWEGAAAEEAFNAVRDDCLAATVLPDQDCDCVGPSYALHVAWSMIHEAEKAEY